MTSLTTEPLASLLPRLFAEADTTDRVASPRARQETLRLGLARESPERAAVYEDVFLAIGPDTGRLLYTLTRAKHPRVAVEFGTSFGLSTLHLAAALRDNGTGHLITTELAPAKVARARDHLHQANLADLVDFREGDAFETLRDTPDAIDLLWLDGWKPLYLPLLRMLEPRLAPGALVIADDMNTVAELATYAAYVRDPANGYTSAPIPLDDSLEISVRG
jgi:predicted O-methyltransferase YrrM